MPPPNGPYYGRDLALVHHRGFGAYATGCADGISALLEPVRARDGLVLELGCGSGLLTRHLIDRGHQVIASDASPAMLELAQRVVPDAKELRQIVLPHDPLPAADAVVSVGHVLNYLSDEAAVERAAIAIANALRPGGILAIDLCGLRWGEMRREHASLATVSDEWAIITESSVPRPHRYVREITTFVKNDNGTWRRDDERHDYVLIDAAEVPRLLSLHGVDASLRTGFGNSALPDGLVAIIGARHADEGRRRPAVRG